MTHEQSMYIIVNNDLNMGKGKAISQAAHAVEVVTEKLVSAMYESSLPKDIIVNYKKYMITGRRKIVLRASQEQMCDLMKEKDAVYIVDEGLTQIPKDSLTAIAFFPSSDNKERFSHLKLVN